MPASRCLRVLMCVAVLAAAWRGASSAQAPSAIDKAFDAFWKADDQKDAEKAADRLLKTGVDFDTAWARLKAGRPYKKEKTGEFMLRRSAGMGAMFENRVEVPEDYDPARSWVVRVQLHGGVNRPAPQTSSGPDIEGDSGNSGGSRDRADAAFQPRREGRSSDPGPFRHRAAAGRVDIERHGNTFEARTRGVRAFRLLLSPDAIDFAQPLTVTVNGRIAFQGTVKKDPAVLLSWAARDNDRTMLYGAELKVTVQ